MTGLLLAGHDLLDLRPCFDWSRFITRSPSTARKWSLACGVRLSSARRRRAVWTPIPGESGDGVVATGTWESKEQCQRAFAGMTQAGIDWQYDHREARPRLVYSLVEPD